MAIIRTAKLLQYLYPASPLLRAVPSTVLFMYPLDQLVFDATVLCASHCFGGVIISSEDGASWARATGSGSAEVMQTMAIGLDLLEAAYGISKDTVELSAHADHDDYSTGGFSGKTKVVASLPLKGNRSAAEQGAAPALKRNRGPMEESVAPALKRNRSAMEESTPPAPSAATNDMLCPRQGESNTRTSNESTQLLPPTSDNRSGIASLAESPASKQRHPTVPPPVAATSVRDPISKPLFTKKDLVEVAVKRRGEHPSSMGQKTIVVRARPERDSSGGSSRRRKQDTKAATPLPPLMTNTPRVIKDGHLNYGSVATPGVHPPVRLPTTPHSAIPQPTVQNVAPPHSLGGHHYMASGQPQEYYEASRRENRYAGPSVEEAVPEPNLRSALLRAALPAIPQAPPPAPMSSNHYYEGNQVIRNNAAPSLYGAQAGMNPNQGESSIAGSFPDLSHPSASSMPNTSANTQHYWQDASAMQAQTQMQPSSESGWP
ncbi:hypothetical protein NMY22_g8758 [Coprinellus aureogranulatus]|nr:hypothetical protein NMY22_g8758 [Coprinellus aureogranulatus]